MQPVSSEQNPQSIEHSISSTQKALATTALIAMLEQSRHPEGPASPLLPQARRLLSQVMDINREEELSAVSQDTAELIFDKLIAPTYILARSARNQANRPQQINDRVEELRKYLNGVKPAEILTGSSNPSAALGGNRTNFIKTLRNQGYDGIYFQQALETAVETGAYPDEVTEQLQDHEQIGLDKPVRRVRQQSKRSIEQLAEMPVSEQVDALLATSRQLLTTRLSEDSVQMYLRQVGDTPLLTAEQEVELSKRIEAGLFAGEKLLQAEQSEVSLDPQYRRDLHRIQLDGTRSKDYFVEANLRLVVSLAKRYTGRGMAFLDLIQEGNLGMIRAVEKFDYKKGYKMSTYATWWIRQAITRSIADQARTIRVPVHMVEQINKLGRIERELYQDLGRKPTDEELGVELDIDPAKVQEIREYGREPVSLDMEIGDSKGRGETESTLSDFIEDKTAAVAFDDTAFGLLREQLTLVLSTLDAREAGVIRHRYGLDGLETKTLDEIGQIYGVTRERIRQIENQTMSKLRHPSRANSLRDYLD